MTRSQRVQQWLRGTCLTHRYGVQPDHRPRGPRGVEAESLGYVLPVCRLVPPTPPQAREHEGESEPKEQPIGGPPHQNAPTASKAVRMPRISRWLYGLAVSSFAPMPLSVAIITRNAASQ